MRLGQIISLSFALLLVGRMETPVEGLTGWHGFYEMLAHLWVGSMLTIASLRAIEATYRLLAAFFLFIASAIELIMFLQHQG